MIVNDLLAKDLKEARKIAARTKKPAGFGRAMVFPATDGRGLSMDERKLAFREVG
jgi:hypothetical protein